MIKPNWTKAQTFRRYYLHKMLKGVIRLDVKARTMYIDNEESLLELPHIKKEYFNELKTVYDYSVQHQIR